MTFNLFFRNWCLVWVWLGFVLTLLFILEQEWANSILCSALTGLEYFGAVYYDEQVNEENHNNV